MPAISLRTVLAAALAAFALLPVGSGANPAPSASLLANIAALQALGGASNGIAFVASYATAGDNGGGVFLWDATSTASPDRCLTFAATGVATGRWVRQLNGLPFNADMCGTGTADDSNAINAALSVCSAKALPLVFSARTYRVQATLTAPAACTFHGAGWLIGNGAVATVFDFSTAPASVTEMFNIIGDPNFGQYRAGAAIGDFQLNDGHKYPRRGLYISRVGNEVVSNVGVYNVLGTGIFIGQQIESAYRNLYVYGSGTATASPLDIDGENSGGTDYESTTTSFYDIHVETDNGGGVTCGISINRNELLAIYGGDSENSGNLLCIGNKPATTGNNGPILVQGFDMENPGNGQLHCVSIGTGSWAGLAGHGNMTLRFIGNTCTTPNVAGAAAYYVSDTTGFYAEGNQVEFLLNNQVYFDFEGTNNFPSLGANGVGNYGPLGTYVMFNGTPQADALEYNPWTHGPVFAGGLSQIFAPGTVGALAACNVALAGARTYVRDATVTLAAGIGTKVVGGGSNTVPVGCNGVNWLVGG